LQKVKYAVVPIGLKKEKPPKTQNKRKRSLRVLTVTETFGIKRSVPDTGALFANRSHQQEQGKAGKSVKRKDFQGKASSARQNVELRDEPQDGTAREEKKSTKKNKGRFV